MEVCSPASRSPKCSLIPSREECYDRRYVCCGRPLWALKVALLVNGKNECVGYKEKHVTHEPRLWLTLNPAAMRIASPTGTRDRHKKVVRCITNVSEAVVHLRRETLRISMFLPMLCN